MNNFLEWEYCDDPEIQYLKCPAPTPMRNHMPEWFKKLKGKRDEVTFAEQQTIRNCLGFRGLASIGYTIPLPEDLDGYDTYFSRGRVQPAMIEGTLFANQGDKPWADDDYSLYEYRFKILNYPWRAKMAKGWRLLILPYLLDWNNDWNEFAGTVEPNYDVQHGTQIIKIHRIKRIKSYFCIAEIELMTLREFNLESLLSGRDRKIYRI